MCQPIAIYGIYVNPKFNIFKNKFMRQLWKTEQWFHTLGIIDIIINFRCDDIVICLEKINYLWEMCTQIYSGEIYLAVISNNQIRCGIVLSIHCCITDYPKI